jgi:hypothetical protein
MPGVSHHTYPFHDQPTILPMEYTELYEGLRIAWIVGRIEYKDAAGNSYYTTCRMQFNSRTRGFSTASTGNDAI